MRQTLVEPDPLTPRALLDEWADATSSPRSATVTLSLSVAAVVLSLAALIIALIR